jgi:hypothetical protein
VTMSEHRYTVVNKEGSRCLLRFVEWRGDCAYLVNDAAASYLANPYSGRVHGVESCAGNTLRLVDAAWRRLHRAAEARRASLSSPAPTAEEG